MKAKYEEIIEYIENLVEQNHLKQGEQLPTIRTLAYQFNYNKSTVIRAYKELELGHKIYSIPKSGYYLVEKNNLSNEVSSIIDFTEVTPDPKLLPYREFNHCINRAVELYKDNLFFYTNTQGLESLRKVLVNHFCEYQIFTSLENICITSGAQQALSILTKITFPNGKKNVLVEQPTYSLIHQLIEMNGDKLIGIDRDNNGINLKELEEIFKNQSIKFFYTIPRLHNPLGTSYSEREKKQIIELAQKYDVYIVEDDYLADIDTNKKVLPIIYYDIWERVVYVKSFSKTFMPGIRLGAVVLPPKLRNEFLKFKRIDDLSTSALAQGALEIFINSGMYKNHNKKAQIAYRQKMNWLKGFISNLDTTGTQILVPDTGFFIWIKLMEDINMVILKKRLQDKKISISLGNEFFINNNTGTSKGIRLCISKLTKDRIMIGMQILFDEIHKLRKY